MKWNAPNTRHSFIQLQSKTTRTRLGGAGWRQHIRCAAERSQLQPIGNLQVQLLSGWYLQQASPTHGPWWVQSNNTMQAQLVVLGEYKATTPCRPNSWSLVSTKQQQHAGPTHGPWWVQSNNTMQAQLMVLGEYKATTTCRPNSRSLVSTKQQHHGGPTHGPWWVQSNNNMQAQLMVLGEYKATTTCRPNSWSLVSTKQQQHAGPTHSPWWVQSNNTMQAQLMVLGEQTYLHHASTVHGPSPVWLSTPYRANSYPWVNIHTIEAHLMVLGRYPYHRGPTHGSGWVFISCRSNSWSWVNTKHQHHPWSWVSTKDQHHTSPTHGPMQRNSVLCRCTP